MFTRVPRLSSFIIIGCHLLAVNWLCVERGKRSVPHEPCRDTINAMRQRTTVKSPPVSPILMLTFVLMFPLIVSSTIVTSACTFYGEHPARALSDATGGEGLERVFWKDVQAANWVEVERALASNYSGVIPSGTLDRSTTLEQYRGWQLKDFALGDLKTELNGNTIVVTYTITLNGVASNGTSGNENGGSRPLPSAPQHMMTVWQKQKSGWVVIAHSVSQSSISQ